MHSEKTETERKHKKKPKIFKHSIFINYRERIPHNGGFFVRMYVDSILLATFHSIRSCKTRRFVHFENFVLVL